MQSVHLSAPAPTGPAFLRLSSIVSSLVDQGHLDAKDVHSQGLSVVQMGMSNEVLRVSIGPTPRFFVKAFSNDRFDGDDACAREHAAQRLAGAGQTPDGPSFLPAAVALDGVADLVIWSAVDGTPAWFATDIDRATCLTLAGQALGRLHGADLEPFDQLPANRPWVLLLGQEAPPQNIAQDTGALAMVTEALRRPAIVDGLARASARWQFAGLIHGDAKPDNMILTGRRDPRICLIDWELAGLGDPAWDLAGALLQTNLETPASGDGLQTLTDAAEALLRSYGRPVTAELLDRLVLFSGCWLVQTAIQFASASDPQASPHPEVCELAERVFIEQPALVAMMERRIC